MPHNKSYIRGLKDAAKVARSIGPTSSHGNYRWREKQLIEHIATEIESSFDCSSTKEGVTLQEKRKKGRG